MLSKMLLYNISLQGLAMLFLPQTPHYLMIRKKEKEAETILKRLKLSTNTRQSLANIRLAIAEEDSTSFRALFNSENNMNGRMLIGIGLVTAQQITGQPNVIYYASDIFKAVGYCTEWSSTLATVALGTMKVSMGDFFLQRNINHSPNSHPKI
jgi:hypothetical protein